MEESGIWVPRFIQVNLTYAQKTEGPSEFFFIVSQMKTILLEYNGLSVITEKTKNLFYKRKKYFYLKKLFHLTFMQK